MAEKTCGKCGGAMEPGFTDAYGLMRRRSISDSEPRLSFVVPGTPTSKNLVDAFKQGLADEPANHAYGISGYRCAKCGLLELYAEEKDVI